MTREETVLELACNVDDMTGEEMGFFLETAIQRGALDAWAQPIFMKKQRPAYALCVLCEGQQEQEMTRLFASHTSTLGVRIRETKRVVFERMERCVCTDYGEVRVKQANGRTHIEYEDIARIAREQNCGIAQATQKILGEVRE